MSLDKTIRFTATCDLCGPGWWEGYADIAPSFPSRTVAFARLRDDYQWRITRRDDGTHAMLCPACAAIEDCVRGGHRWVPLEYEFDGIVRCYGQVCQRCSVVRSHDDPPVGHPDSMTAELSEAEETWLAEMDELLDPDRASEEV